MDPSEQGPGKLYPQKHRACTACTYAFEIWALKRHAAPKEHFLSFHGLRQREVSGTVDDIPVNAIPDYGSSVDAISEAFARKHNLEIRPADGVSLPLPGGGVAVIVGDVVGDFKFRGESQTYTRHFRVLRECAFDMVLGRAFLKQTKTLTDFCHRIVERFRPCTQKGGRVFLLDEPPEDRIRCTVNGSNASAFPDTGSDLMLVSGGFARRNNFTIRSGREYRRQVQLADGSLIQTDGMVLGAELEFDAPPMFSSHEVNLDQYREYDRRLTALMSKDWRAKMVMDKSVFICDLHVVENLPCDIILSSDFIFENRVFSRFSHLFSSGGALPPQHLSPCSGAKMSLDNSLMIIRMSNQGKSMFSRLRRRPPTPTQPGANNSAVPLQAVSSWEQLWEKEEERRDRTQLHIASLPEPARSDEQRAEDQKRADWDRQHPRPPPPTPPRPPPPALVLPRVGSSLGLGGLGIPGAPAVPAAPPTAGP